MKQSLQPSITKLTIFLICSFCCLVSSEDTLRPGSQLNSSSQLVSANGVFSLGFYTPGPDRDSTTRYYLAINYTQSSNPYLVWIGNRESPVSADSNPLLTVDATGKLVITHSGGEPIQLYAGSSSSLNAIATLSNTGNFVVKDLTSNGDEVLLWQSFDYPTDTLLPGMKLGVDYRTGRIWRLTSWFGEYDPAPGAFTLEWDLNRGRLLIKRRGMVIWTSGELKDYYVEPGSLRVKEFEHLNVRPDAFNANYNFTNVTLPDEAYFSYSLFRVPNMTPEYRTVISGWTLNYVGNVTDVHDGDGGRGLGLATASECYGYNNDGGCELWDQPTCRMRGETFAHRLGFFLPVNGQSPSVHDANRSLTLSDCRDNCWKDCECSGYTEATSGCIYYIRAKSEFVQSLDRNGNMLYVFQSPVSDKGKKKRVVIIVVVVVSSVAFLLFGIGFFVVRKVKQGKEKEELHELLTLEGYTENYDLENGGTKSDLKLFSYASIQSATNNFSPDHKMGQGGFGPVYKGKTPEGKNIAVKVLSQQSGQGLLEFKTELILISKLQHVNLVKLHGFCIHGNEKMIVYDYMPNKSLDFFLFSPSKRQLLNWPQRFNIIEGIAQGLLYLHKYSRLKIIHRDLKPSNILLDENINPKISDFGLARIFKDNIDEANTERRVGTYGYMAPEYAMQGILSVKSDVYSFGVLILEIVSGRKNNSFHETEGPLNLVEHAWELWKTNSAIELMDLSLRSTCVADQLQRCIHVGLVCVENHADDRPSIEDVLSMLKNETAIAAEPQNPAFTTRRMNFVSEEDVEKTTPEKIQSSANDITISELGGR